VVEQPIRNRQVASSTLALGSNISLKLCGLQNSIDWLLCWRCMIVAYSQFFTQRIHCAHLRFVHTLDVDVHR
jgi:hypothetical protein